MKQGNDCSLRNTKRHAMEDDMPDQEETIRQLERRIETLERQVATLLKRTKGAAAPARDYRDRYDSLDYPER